MGCWKLLRRLILHKGNAGNYLYFTGDMLETTLKADTHQESCRKLHWMLILYRWDAGNYPGGLYSTRGMLETTVDLYSTEGVEYKSIASRVVSSNPHVEYKSPG